MSHEIEFTEGVANICWAGETPWHGLGTKVDSDLTPYQMLKAAGLNWRVRKLPMFARYTDKKTGEVTEIESKDVALVRSSDNKILSIISEDWEPVQNEDAFRFFNEFVQAGDMEMHTAGSLRGGNLVWGLAKVKESFEVFGGDKIESYLLFSNPHEYGKCVDVRFTPIRVVCNNTLTLSLSLKGDRMVRLNHRRKFDADAVKKMLGIASKKLGTYKQVAELLGSKEYDDETVTQYFSEVFPTTSKKEVEEDEYLLSRPARTALEILETQPGAEFAPNTWWSAFNAVTFATDHLLGRSTDTRLNSAWYGVNRERKVTALEKAVEYAKMS